MTQDNVTIALGVISAVLFITAEVWFKPALKLLNLQIWKKSKPHIVKNKFEYISLGDVARRAYDLHKNPDEENYRLEFLDFIEGYNDGYHPGALDDIAKEISRYIPMYGKQELGNTQIRIDSSELKLNSNDRFGDNGNAIYRVPSKMMTSPDMRIWKDICIKKEDEQKALDRIKFDDSGQINRNNESFHLKIKEVIPANFTDLDNRDKGTALIAFVTLKNTGRPDTPDEWKMAIESPDGSKYDPIFLHISVPVKVDGIEKTLLPTNTIHEKSKYPLTTGAIAGGHIIFKIRDKIITVSDLMKMKVTISCKYGNNQVCSDTAVFSGISTKIGYDPNIGA